MEITAVERIALNKLSEGHSFATHWIAKACGFGNDTAKGRRLLKRLERRGLVEPHPYQSGLVYHYGITDAGRALLAQGEG